MKNTWNYLQGKKTYIVGAVSILYLLTQYWAGTITPQEAVEGLLAVLGLASLRHGVTKR